MPNIVGGYNRWDPIHPARGHIAGHGNGSVPSELALLISCNLGIPSQGQNLRKTSSISAKLPGMNGDDAGVGERTGEGEGRRGNRDGQSWQEESRGNERISATTGGGGRSIFHIK